MDGCKCHLGATDHEDTMECNKKEISRLRWAEPFKIAKPKVIALMEENISITNCIGEDSSNLEELLYEFQKKFAIRKGSQLGLREVHPDVMGNRKNKGAKRNPIELARERQRIAQFRKSKKKKETQKKIKEIKKKIKRVRAHTGEWRGVASPSKGKELDRLQKKLEKQKKKLKKNRRNRT